MAGYFSEGYTISRGKRVACYKNMLFQPKGNGRERTGATSLQESPFRRGPFGAVGFPGMYLEKSYP